MKTLLLTIASLLFATSLYASDFSEGFKVGYKKGYQYKHGQFDIAPIAPLPPLPEAGQHSFLDGYNEGFLQGLAEQ